MCSRYERGIEINLEQIGRRLQRTAVDHDDLMNIAVRQRHRRLRLWAIEAEVSGWPQMLPTPFSCHIAGGDGPASWAGPRRSSAAPCGCCWDRSAILVRIEFQREAVRNAAIPHATAAVAQRGQSTPGCWCTRRPCRYHRSGGVLDDEGQAVGRASGCPAPASA